MNTFQETGKMIPANKDGKILIKETDQYYYHVKLQRRAINPNNAAYPNITEIVQIFPKEEFEVLENLRNAKQPVVWFHAAGFSEAVVVHDPTLLPPPEKAEITGNKSAEEKRKERDVEYKIRRLANLKAARDAKAAAKVNNA